MYRDADASVYFPRMHLTFPLGEGIALRINSSSRDLKGYLSGNLTVDMNSDESVNNTVLVANTRFSDARLIKESSVCLTQFGNTTQITVHVRIAYSSTSC